VYSSTVSYLTTEEKCKALQNSVSLRNLFEEICKPTTGINFTSYKFRLRTYSHCFLGSELVDWLICQQKAKTRLFVCYFNSLVYIWVVFKEFRPPLWLKLY